MSRTVVLECDCKCGASATDDEQRYWFKLSQDLPILARGEGDDPKLTRKLHFKSLECLKGWAEKACEVLPGLQASAQSLYPRGSFSSDKVEGLYV